MPLLLCNLAMLAFLHSVVNTFGSLKESQNLTVLVCFLFLAFLKNCLRKAGLFIIYSILYV